MWQIAFITFEDKSSINHYYHQWSANIMDYLVKVFPMDLTKEQLELRDSYTLKLACLPPNTTHKDLEHVIEETSAATCVIPKSNDLSYRNLKFAYIGFKDEESAQKAYNTYYSLKGMRLHWVHPETPLCFLCAAPNHRSNNCNLNQRKPNRSRDRVDKLYEKFKPAQYKAKPQYFRNIRTANNPKPTYTPTRNRTNNRGLTPNQFTSSEQKSYSLAIRNGYQPVTRGTAKGGSMHQKQINNIPPKGL